MKGKDARRELVFAEIDAEHRRKEVNTEGEKYGKGPIEDDDEDSTPGGGTAKRTSSTTEHRCGMIGKGDYERWFAYEVPLPKAPLLPNKSRDFFDKP